MTLSLPLSFDLPGSRRAPGAGEAELVARLQAGSEAAFRQLVERYQGRVYRLALTLLTAPAEAEDVAQEVFVEVYQTVGSFRGEAALGTWLYRLTVSRALRQRRWNGAKRRFAHFTSLLGLHNQVLHEVADHAHPQALLEAAQQVEQLRYHLGRLPARQQLAFVLRHEHELSYEQIAAVLTTSVAAVESALFRARQTLRQALHLTSCHARRPS